MSLTNWVGTTVKAAVLVVLAVCGSTKVHTQTIGADSGKPKIMKSDADLGWEVVTIKPSDPDAKWDGFNVNGRHVEVKNKPVEAILMVAYSLQKNQIVGLPDWARTERFDVDGIPDTDGEPGWPQIQVLMRRLLAERFGMTVHHEQREMPVFALKIATGGSKLMQTKSDPNELPHQNTHGGEGLRSIEFTNTSMKELTLELLIEVNRPVVDQTGLAGRYDFKLNYTKNETAAPTDGSAPPGLFTAIQEQMGLKLEPVKAPADVILVDALHRPDAN